ncbi:MAG: hypothetical protein NTY66_01265 [Candidatus Vogelbacteria bacterium]|nr:hypothetical protein [Candidatus Vogelbacteria bacterium]
MENIVYISAIVLFAVIVIGLILQKNGGGQTSTEPLTRAGVTRLLEKIVDPASKVNTAILSSTGPDNYYVQLSYDKKSGSGRIEAVSNTYLSAEYKLTPDQEGRLRALGFNEENGGNFVMDTKIADRSRVSTVAEVIERTLGEVYNQKTIKIKSFAG